jgi:hypothetical protein
MLILDKQKAVERIVALSRLVMEVNPEAPPSVAGARARRTVATYERRPPMRAPSTPQPATAAPVSARRRRRRRTAGGPAFQGPATSPAT